MSVAWLAEARAATLAFVHDLDDDALRAQPDAEFSPIAWHLGHVAFTEASWILARCCGDRSLSSGDCAARWAQGATPKAERARQPPKDVILAYMAEVRARVLDVLPRLAHPLAEHGYLSWLIASHEHQHRETMAVVRRLALERDLSPPPPPTAGSAAAPAITFERTTTTLGTGAKLAYDNERPAHEIEIAPFEIDRGLVTVDAWETFRADGGYQREVLWSRDGWRWARENVVSAPRGWTRHAGQLAQLEGGGLIALARDAPVSGVSWYEADAFARWRGARLPAEHEWEHAAARLTGVGGAWEWTSTAFAPYPGFEAFPYRGYSVPYFDGAHRVLRGGSPVTHASMLRPTFRNWYLPHVRALSSGLRCARSL